MKSITYSETFILYQQESIIKYVEVHLNTLYLISF